jgi:hypothetical protein
VEFAEGATSDFRNYRVDCELLPRTLPEYKPCWNARIGAQELYDAYSRAHITLKDFEGSRFSRLAHLQELIATGVVDSALRVTASEAA